MYYISDQILNILMTIMKLIKYYNERFRMWPKSSNILIIFQLKLLYFALIIYKVKRIRIKIEVLKKRKVLSKLFETMDLMT